VRMTLIHRTEKRERERWKEEKKHTGTRRTDENHSELLSRSKVLDGSLDFGLSGRLESVDLLGQLEREEERKEKGTSARACEKRDEWIVVG